MNKPRGRLRLAMQLGREAPLRLRAECLLEHGEKGEVTLTEDERERLLRIAVVPSKEDGAFLAGFGSFCVTPAGDMRLLTLDEITARLRVGPD